MYPQYLISSLSYGTFGKLSCSAEFSEQRQRRQSEEQGSGRSYWIFCWVRKLQVCLRVSHRLTKRKHRLLQAPGCVYINWSLVDHQNFPFYLIDGGSWTWIAAQAEASAQPNFSIFVWKQINEILIITMSKGKLEICITTPQHSVLTNRKRPHTDRPLWEKQVKITDCNNGVRREGAASEEFVLSRSPTWQTCCPVPSCHRVFTAGGEKTLSE